MIETTVKYYCDRCGKEIVSNLCCRLFTIA